MGISNRIIVFLCWMTVLPVFLTGRPPFIDLQGTRLAVATNGSLDIHVTLLTGPIALLILCCTRRAIPGGVPLLRGFALLAAWLTTVSFTVTMFTTTGDTSALRSLAQILLPATYLLVGLHLGALGLGHNTLKHLFILLFAYQALLIISNVGELGLGDGSHAIAANFPQFLTYYPGVLALGTIITWTQLRRHRALAFGYYASVVILMPAVWSRLGLATLCVAILYCAFVRAGTHSRGTTPRKAATIGLSLAFVCAIVMVALKGTIGQRLETKSSLLQSGRGTLMREGLERVYSSPFIGDGGRALYDRRDFGGGADQGLRLFPSHNQLIDLGIRGGVPAIILACACAISLGLLAIRILRSHPDHVAAVMPGALIVVGFASISDLYFSQALTASLTWLLIGLGWGAHQKTSEAEAASIVTKSISAVRT